MHPSRLSAISLFSGALGLDLGLERAGFTIRSAVECNKFALETIKLNRPDLGVIPQKIETVTTKEILKKADLKAGEPFVVTGGPSCQTFSTVGQRASFADPRGRLFDAFVRVIREARPRFFVMENVRGVLSAAVRHRSLAQRGPGFPPLAPDEELGSALNQILSELRQLDYYTVFGVVTAADYGVPSVRERVIFIGSRDGEPVMLPPATHAEEPTGPLKNWVTLREALKGLKDPAPVYSELCKSKKRFLKRVPAGGNWRDLPPKLQKEALGGAFDSWGGRVGFFRRLAWNRPAPALTTRPDSKATMLCHPTELRPLSVREYARIQQFPDEWKFAGGPPQQYIQIGNAVPVGLGEAIGRSLVAVTRRRKSVATGVVQCADPELLKRLAGRPRTVLNPPRMRLVEDHESAKKWLGESHGDRSKILDYVGVVGDDQ